jgi:LacI family transcriptional regulator
VPFTAVFASNDLMAYGARLALSQHGVAVPEEVSLVGFDDLPLSQYLTPPLTTMRQPAYTMGMDAARGVLAMLEGRAFEAPRYRAEWVARGSTAATRLEPVR